MLFNRSLSAGVFPEILKKSYIVPIYKKGSINDIKNYRPIAILPVIAKVFEKVVLSRIDFMLSHYITPRQHGFTSGRSPATNLMVFQTDVFDAFRERKQVDAVELDFSKAFDRVNHGLLLKKLEACGFVGGILQWLSSYLRGRKLQVRYNGVLSRAFVPTSGVPQGSILGPAMFKIFINDIVTDLRSSSLLFADDLKLYQRISSDADLDILQNSVDSVSQWCLRNKMALNTDKCFCITFHRNMSPAQRDYTIDGVVLERSSEVRDLGVQFSNNLSWDRQVRSVCGKALRNLGLIHRLARSFTSLHCLRLLYCTLVRPHLEYCSIIWSPHQIYLKEELESVQRRFLRLVGTRLGHRYMEVPLIEVSTLLHLPSLESRRFNQDVLFLQRLVTSELDCPDLLERINFRVPSGTRSRDLFTTVAASTNYAMNSTILRIQRHGNSVAGDLDMFGSSGVSFRRSLLSWQETQSL